MSMYTCCNLLHLIYTVTYVHLMQKHSLPVQFKIKIRTNSLITPLNTPTPCLLLHVS